MWSHKKALDRRMAGAASRRVMERRRRGRRRGSTRSSGGSSGGSSGSSVVKLVLGLLLVCVVLGLALQLGGGRLDQYRPALPGAPLSKDAGEKHGRTRYSVDRRTNPNASKRRGWKDLSESADEISAWEPREPPAHFSPPEKEPQDKVGPLAVEEPIAEEPHGGEALESSSGEEGVRRDPADGVDLTYEVGGLGAGPIETFLSGGGKLPVLLLTCNRPQLLQDTIESLRQVRGMDMSQVLVLQDGKDQAVQRVVKDAGLYLEQNMKTPNLKGGPKPGSDGAARIAQHYKFALNHVFEERKEAPAVIIIEDDLRFSPDFLEYMEYNAPILERDSSTLILSAWNDNGFKGRVSDKTELQRTMFFPGLGWLLPRKLYEEELRSRWPKTHWDHWLRERAQHKGRECIFPEVPRTFHGGVRGTFMDEKTHNKFFRDIDYNTDPGFSWGSLSPAPGDGPPLYAKAMKFNYERRVEARIASARHVNDIEDLTAAAAGATTDEVVFWYSLPVTEKNKAVNKPFQPIASMFGLWHEYKRGEHSGMHTFRYSVGEDRSLHVMLINAALSPYKKFKPDDLKPAEGGTARAPPASSALPEHIVAGDAVSQSCTEVCASKGLACREGMFRSISRCDLLRQYFPCTVCDKSYGPDQPCYVTPDAPSDKRPGECLISSQPDIATCGESHHLTRRLCPCVSQG